MRGITVSDSAEKRLESEIKVAKRDASLSKTLGAYYLCLSGVAFAGATYATLKGNSEAASVITYGGSATFGLVSGLLFYDGAEHQQESETLQSLLPENTETAPHKSNSLQ